MGSLVEVAAAVEAEAVPEAAVGVEAREVWCI